MYMCTVDMCKYIIYRAICWAGAPEVAGSPIRTYSKTKKQRVCLVGNGRSLLIYGHLHTYLYIIYIYIIHVLYIDTYIGGNDAMAHETTVPKVGTRA